jgi:hypothetical protein
VLRLLDAAVEASISRDLATATSIAKRADEPRRVARTARAADGAAA